MSAWYRFNSARLAVPKGVLWVLAAGFGAIILLLLGAGYLGIRAMQAIEDSATRLVDEQRAVTTLIDRLQRVEADLTSIFYSLASARGERDIGALQRRLNLLEQHMEEVARHGANTREREAWHHAHHAAKKFVAEIRKLLAEGPNAPASAAFFEGHEQFLEKIAKLVEADYADSSAQESATIQRSSARISQSFALLWLAVAISVGGAVVTIGVANAVFKRLEWQASELAALSRHTIESQETTARRFSRELHDEFGQTLSALEANLVAMRRSNPETARLDDCMALVKDAMSNVRQMSQLLRPSILDDFGLNAGVAWLGETFEQRTGIKVQFDSSLNVRLSDETETHLFRIAQEALTNVARHANASRVQIELIGVDREVSLRISDDGQGLKQGRGRGMGLIGMRARARSAGGKLDVTSRPDRGCEVRVVVPVGEIGLEQENTHTTG